MAEQKTLSLIDLSSIFRQNWHALESEEVNEAMRRTVERVRNIAGNYDHTAVCVDSPPYKRAAMSSAYKAHREKSSSTMIEQLRLAREQLDRDGLHLVGRDGYEADDIIGSLAEQGSDAGLMVYVHSADKDLMQTVGLNVRFKSTATREEYDSDGVKAKLMVHPELVPDLLALTGDKSDGIQGIKGVGPKTAAKWLNEFGDLVGVMNNAHEIEPERFREVLLESRDLIATNWKLTRLLEPEPAIDLNEILEKKDPIVPHEEPDLDGEDLVDDSIPEPAESLQVAVPEIVQGEPQAAIVPSGNWERALEPQDSKQAWGVAKMLYESRMFGDWPSPHAIMACIMTGRMYGMDAVSSLRGFHNIKGKMSPSSMTLIGLVKRHPTCKYLRLVESTEQQAVWEAWRKGEPDPIKLSFTVVEAKAAGYLPGNSGSQWAKQPKLMLRWRCAVNLARAVWPDVISGLYAVEELRDIED